MVRLKRFRSLSGLHYACNSLYNNYYSTKLFINYHKIHSVKCSLTSSSPPVTRHWCNVEAGDWFPGCSPSKYNIVTASHISNGHHRVCGMTAHASWVVYWGTSWQCVRRVFAVGEPFTMECMAVRIRYAWYFGIIEFVCLIRLWYRHYHCPLLYIIIDMSIIANIKCKSEHHRL